MVCSIHVNFRSIERIFRQKCYHIQILNPSVITPITGLEDNQHQQFYQKVLIKQIYEVLEQSIYKRKPYFLLKLMCKYYTELHGEMKGNMNCPDSISKISSNKQLRNHNIYPETRVQKIYLFLLCITC